MSVSDPNYFSNLLAFDKEAMHPAKDLFDKSTKIDTLEASTCRWSVGQKNQYYNVLLDKYC